MIVDRDHRRVTDQVGGQGLVKEALHQVGTLAPVGVQDLDGDAALQSLMHRLVDLAHAAGTDAADDAVIADNLAFLQERRHGIYSP